MVVHIPEDSDQDEEDEADTTHEGNAPKEESKEEEEKREKGKEWKEGMAPATTVNVNTATGKRKKSFHFYIITSIPFM